MELLQHQRLGVHNRGVVVFEKYIHTVCNKPALLADENKGKQDKPGAR